MLATEQMTLRILLVDDEINVRKTLSTYLESQGHDVIAVSDCQDALAEATNNHFDVAFVDLRLKNASGSDLIPELIAQSPWTKIVIMTAHAMSEDDIAKGLNLGADEYMLKPIRNIEFHARVKALLRRAQLSDEDGTQPVVYADDYLMVDVDARRVWVGGQETRLTPTEFKLLSTFIRHRGQVLTFQQLLEQVWGFEYTTEHHYPRIYVSHLRRKIEPDAKAPTYIQNEYGIGYRFTGKS